MPKKITIVSAAALVLLSVITAILLTATANSRAAVPRRVSVYLPPRSLRGA